jgi:DNA oxidative demethylase
MIRDLFEAEDLQLAPGAMLLSGFALRFEAPCFAALGEVVAVAPFRHMVTPTGHRMSVAMTNCGTVGWVTDRTGYRYDSQDPETGRPWPAMPDAFADLAARAAARAGFEGFEPDACLINRYEPGSRLSLHQDRNERDFSAPIVSVSLGLPAVFLFGGLRRADAPRRVPVAHGDVVVWGGPARLRYHGVRPLEAGHHP